MNFDIVYIAYEYLVSINLQMLLLSQTHILALELAHSFWMKLRAPVVKPCCHLVPALRVSIAPMHTMGMQALDARVSLLCTIL